MCIDVTKVCLLYLQYRVMERTLQAFRAIGLEVQHFLSCAANFADHRRIKGMRSTPFRYNVVQTCLKLVEMRWSCESSQYVIHDSSQSLTYVKQNTMLCTTLLIYGRWLAFRSENALPLIVHDDDPWVDPPTRDTRLTRSRVLTMSYRLQVV